MSLWLETQGFQPRAARTGIAALSAARQYPRPAVILLDLMMPIMDGWEFRRRQLADPAIAEIPVVVVSALAAYAGDALRAAAIVQKPCNFDELTSVIRRFV